MGALGTNLPRLDATEKATGRAAYMDDLRLPGTLHGRFLRSPHPHARILHIDADRARRLPGVRAVVTGADAPAVRHGRVIRDETAFPTTRVRFMGERVAAVAAIDPDIAEEAVGLIRVEYEPLPALHTPEEAMREGAPVLHEELASYVSEVKAERFGNVCARFLTVQGAGADGFAEADLVGEDSFTTHIAHQAYIEPHCVLAACEPSGRATVWTNAQSPFDVRRVLAEVTGLPESQIRVVVPPIGGAFGGKLYLMDEPQALLLALRAGKPVKLQMTYEDEFLAGYPRHPSTIHLRTGVKANGELVAREARIIVDSGAYAGYGPATAAQIARWIIGPYRIPHTRVEASCVYTNKMNCGFYRGPGHTQAVFACETQIDRLAAELGQDPVEFRLRNLEDNGPGMPDFRAILRRAAEGWGWGKPLPRRAMGRGIAVSHRGSGGRPASAWVRLNNDGTATTYTGTVDLTGSNVALAQVVAEELGLPTQRVAVVSGDTDATPFDSGTNGSRVTFVTGGTVRQAAAQVRRRLLELAAESLEASVGDLELQDGAVQVKGTPSRRVSYATLARQALQSAGGPIFGQGSTTGAEDPGGLTFAVQMAEVEVDEETGMVHVRRLAAVHDVGRAINPLSIEGQVAGGVAQGMGFALTEWLRVQDGQVLTTNLMTYLLPTAPDVPRVEVSVLEEFPGAGPFGAKGVGEQPVIPTAAAIANALANATGVQLRDLPLTAERVLAALRARAKPAGSKAAAS